MFSCCVHPTGVAATGSVLGAASFERALSLLAGLFPRQGVWFGTVSHPEGVLVLVGEVPHAYLPFQVTKVLP